MAAVSSVTCHRTVGSQPSTRVGERRNRSRGCVRRPAAYGALSQGRLHCSIEVSSVIQYRRRLSTLRRGHSCVRRSAKDAVEQGTTDATTTEEDGVDWPTAIKLFIFPALGGLLFGYDIGATSGAMVSLKSAATSGTDWGPALSPLASGAVVSSSLAGALIGSAIALSLGNRLGRKQELLLAASLYGGSAALMAASPSLSLLLLGHVGYGLGIGFGMHAAPAYIAETVPPQVRGLFVSLKECLVVTGILLGYLIGNVLIDQDGGWRMMYGAAIPMAGLLGVGMLALPESPRWLLLSGKRSKEAADSLRQSMGSKCSQERVDEELRAMERNAAAKEGDEKQKFTDIFTRSSYRKPLLLGTSLMLFQQITGQPSVLYYAAPIFQDAGFSAAADATRVSVLLGAFKLLVTGVACWKVDSWGRRPLLLAGITGMVASLAVLAGTSEGMLGDASSLTSVAALLLYVGCYQLSFGPISWLIVGEVFPLAVRGQALAIAAIVNFGSNFGVSLVLPYAEDSFGLAGLYLVFAALGVCALSVVYTSVPETRGKTLEEIEAFWGDSD